MDNKPLINYEDFSQVDLRVAKVATAERVADSAKLLKLEVILGEDKRQIIAGLGKKYEPEILIGRSVVIVANLEPRLIMGLESAGMVLAVDTDSGPTILLPDQEVAPGSFIH
ncbi:MAG: methionine--tRNA ligase subunit beta [Candidatus Vogelbacteria bacterium RIFOXYD1_FULL_44_32]|uniref:Methionine--tRNA ligase n=1 Tax=Candidatus Vogelbacteria bacterium RIFOXYD1_FULL_44_32 TaxID=1802438 RepID=A0A1G2QE87_9BACT|nr:MAG: methionine--tRNA ligase subunit beta [Candidatus Vogelbacteria bacterium RIFOXYD1_FULL_44_32]